MCRGTILRLHHEGTRRAMAPRPIAEAIRQTKPFHLPAEEAFVSLLRTADLAQWRQAALFREHRITPTQYNVLRILRGSMPQGLRCNEIGRRLITRVPDVTRLLDRMEQAGLIDRRRSGSDRREVIVTLTRQGATLVNNLDEPVRAFEAATIGRLGARRLKELISILEEAREHFGEEP